MIRGSFLQKAVFLLLLALFSQAYVRAEVLAEDLKIHELSHSKEWKLLLHYQPKWISRKERSLLDGPGFYLSPQGKEDPEAEMKATIAVFNDNQKLYGYGSVHQPAQCAFPVRLEYLKEHLGIHPVPAKCEKLDEYLAKFNHPQSTVMVFSSALPNNPGSMFGHTFLRINAKKEADQSLGKNDLLDHGLSFAANVPPDEGRAMFYYFGLVGGYPGTFSLQPYYQKVNEYVQSDSRDLWEYELSLTPTESERLIKHIWELEANSYFFYYFFDENCAYQLVAAIEAIKPEWKLTDESIYVTPIGTVKALMGTPGAVRKIRWRPSLRQQIIEKLSGLSPAEKASFQELMEGKLAPQTVNDSKLLEVAALNLHYKKQKAEGKVSDSDKALLKNVLIQRSHFPVDTGNAPVAREEFPKRLRPDLGHGTYRIRPKAGVSQGRLNPGQSYFISDLHFKFAYHDLLDDDQGFIPFSQIDFPDFTLRYHAEDKHLRVEQITGFQIVSLMPLNFFEKTFSWKIALDYYSPKDVNCGYCHAARFQAGAGITLPLGTPDFLFYSLLVPQIEAGNDFGNTFRFDPKLESAFLVHFLERAKLKAGYVLTSDLFQSYRPSIFHNLNAAFSLSTSQNSAFGFEIDDYLHTSLQTGAYRSWLASFSYYF